jgi:hypothetical protein
VIFGSFYELGLCGEFVGMIKVGPGFFSYIWPLEFLWALGGVELESLAKKDCPDEILENERAAYD